jgi:hypothetical protein
MTHLILNCADGRGCAVPRLRIQRAVRDKGSWAFSVLPALRPYGNTLAAMIAPRLRVAARAVPEMKNPEP